MSRPIDAYALKEAMCKECDICSDRPVISCKFHNVIDSMPTLKVKEKQDLTGRTVYKYRAMVPRLNKAWSRNGHLIANYGELVDIFIHHKEYYGYMPEIFVVETIGVKTDNLHYGRIVFSTREEAENKLQEVRNKYGKE